MDSAAASLYMVGFHLCCDRRHAGKPRAEEEMSPTNATC
jgi:regulator of replication initiation timing